MNKQLCLIRRVDWHPSNLMDTLTEDALAKLSAAQLKALWKERLLVGYSKCNKVALVQGILDFQNGVAPIKAIAKPTRPTKKKTPAEQPILSQPPTVARKIHPSSTANTALADPSSNVPRNISMLSGPSIATEPSQIPPSQGASHPSLRAVVVAPSTSARVSQPAGPSNTNKRKSQEDDRATKKPKPVQAKTVTSVGAITLKPSSAGPLPPAQPRHKAHAPISTNIKRFMPLVVNKVVLAPPALEESHSLSQQSQSQLYLDFPEPLPVTLTNVSLPPSLSQRKHVSRYALILSQVREEDLKQCILVSRMFRYAAYISASYRLLHDFSGYRFAIILQMYPQTMTNMWPYLRERRNEVAQRRAAYGASFLATIFEKREMISPRLWTNPDNDKQLTIAIRFLLTRLFFSVSIGQPSTWLDAQITNVQQLVPGEIWCVTMSEKSFYVLEATCEVVGRPTTPSGESSEIPVRADWSKYIAHRLVPPTVRTVPPPPLLEQVSWTNHEEYEHGISRHWLKRIRREGKLGAMKETIAERYIFACVVGNSLSGEWKSSTEMAQDFSGSDLVTGYVPAKTRTPKVNLFIPAHHHVESVHFTSSRGRPLHAALAIVQTPGREYIIFKDNGMQVGTEEDGVGRVWMKMIGCTSSGE